MAGCFETPSKRFEAASKCFEALRSRGPHASSSLEAAIGLEPLRGASKQLRSASKHFEAASKRLEAALSQWLLRGCLKREAPCFEALRSTSKPLRSASKVFRNTPPPRCVRKVRIIISEALHSLILCLLFPPTPGGRENWLVAAKRS